MVTIHVPMLRTTRLSIILSTVLAVLLSACSSPAATPSTGAPAGGAAAPSSIKIGAVVPLTGGNASLGDQVNNGYQVAVEDINKNGGVKLGNVRAQLELKVLDDESNPSNTVQRMESLYSSENVVAYLGGAGSNLHAAAVPIAEKNKTPYLGVAFGLYSIHQQGLKYLFSPFPKSPDLTKMSFDLLDTLNPKPTRVAIFRENTDWGREMGSLWTQQANSRGYQVVVDQEYALGAQDFSPMILAAKAANADAVLAQPVPPDGLAIEKQMKELDFNANVYIVIRAADALVWGQNLGKDGDYVILAPGWSADLKFPGVDQLKSEYQAKYNKPADALVGAAYATVQILAAAIERAGKADRDAIRDALTQTDMMTVNGPVKFNPDGSGQIITVALQWQNGKQTLVWPRDQAASPIAYPAPAWGAR